MGDWVGWGCLTIWISLGSSVGLFYQNHETFVVGYSYHFVLGDWFPSPRFPGPAAQNERFQSSHLAAMSRACHDWHFSDSTGSATAYTASTTPRVTRAHRKDRRPGHPTLHHSSIGERVELARMKSQQAHITAQLDDMPYSRDGKNLRNQSLNTVLIGMTSERGKRDAGQVRSLQEGFPELLQSTIANESFGRTDGAAAEGRGVKAELPTRRVRRVSVREREPVCLCGERIPNPLACVAACSAACDDAKTDLDRPPCIDLFIRRVTEEKAEGKGCRGCEALRAAARLFAGCKRAAGGRVF